MYEIYPTKNMNDKGTKSIMMIQNMNDNETHQRGE